MAGYLDLGGFKSRTLMPATEVDALEKAAPGWLLQKLETVSRVDIDPKLRKRYDAPFDVVTCPEAVKAWLEQIVTELAYVRLGVDPNDMQFQSVSRIAERAHLAIAEAANAVDGLYDLPLRDSEKATGITKGAPRGYAEPGPYHWLDVQREALE